MMKKVEYKKDNKIIESSVMAGGAGILTAVALLNPVLGIPAVMGGVAAGIGAGVAHGLASIMLDDDDDD